MRPCVLVSLFFILNAIAVTVVESAGRFGMVNICIQHLPTPFPSSFCTSSSFPDKAAWCSFCNLVPLLAF